MAGGRSEYLNLWRYRKSEASERQWKHGGGWGELFEGRAELQVMGTRTQPPAESEGGSFVSQWPNAKLIDFTQSPDRKRSPGSAETKLSTCGISFD